MLNVTLILCKASLDQNYKCNYSCISWIAYLNLYLLQKRENNNNQILEISWYFNDIHNMEPAGQIILRNVHDHSPS